VSVEGRWVGHWFEWACPGCGTMQTALQGPSDEGRCGSCKADKRYQEAMQALVERVESEKNEWCARALNAERELRAAQREIETLKGAAA